MERTSAKNSVALPMPTVPTAVQPPPAVALVGTAVTSNGAVSSVSTSSTQIPGSSQTLSGVSTSSENAPVASAGGTSAPSTPANPTQSKGAAASVTPKAVCGAKTKKGKLCQNPIITRFGICPVHASLVGGVRAKRVAAAGANGGSGSGKKRRKSAAASSSKRLRQEPFPAENSPLSVLDALLPLSPVSLEAPPTQQAVDTLRWEPTLALEELYPTANVQDGRYEPSMGDFFTRDADDIVPLKLDLDTEPF